jgi:predicted metal-dependent hydrolase
MLKRSAKRRRAVLTVDETGLTVSVPWRTSDRYIAQLLRDAEAWVLRKLETWASRRPRQRQWQSGELIDFLGRQLRLELIVREGTAIAQLKDGNVLELCVPAPHEQQRVREAVVKWYRRHAASHFQQRVEHYSARLALPAPRVFLSNAQTRWGSCNAQREVRLNWRLMQAPSHILDYVVAHEVSHLMVMSHSSRFWKVVAKLHPEYESARTELNAMSQHYMSL